MGLRVVLRAISIAILLTACGGNVDEVRPGAISRNTILSSFGEPKAKYEVIGDRLSTDAMSYGEKSTNLQFFDDRVVAVNRDPKKEEEHINFWISAWRKKGVRWQVIPPSKHDHAQSVVQYRSDEESVIISVSTGTGRVFRVHHFERGPSL